MHMKRRTIISGVGVLALAALATSCVGSRTLTDPTLEIRTPHGSELGVSTDYGVIFLGRTAQSGSVEITAWFGDGPSIESSVIEPIGGGLYTAETEISEEAKILLGLVSGKITLKNKDGERSYLTVVGPEDLWRLVVHRRDFLQRRRWVYRQDIL